MPPCFHHFQIAHPSKLSFATSATKHPMLLAVSTPPILWKVSSLNMQAMIDRKIALRVVDLVDWVICNPCSCLNEMDIERQESSGFQAGEV
ncbi:hypothetical protein M5K25_022695 [Dendrobium thyrsiflorum]|uniref:Uncharacterized protein n=1 Tax=Dendrobium thyrsiflorum TaxID=117978 RepID=A0ABD0UCY2_DENTH